MIYIAELYTTAWNKIGRYLVLRYLLMQAENVMPFAQKHCAEVSPSIGVVHLLSLFDSSAPSINKLKKLPCLDGHECLVAVVEAPHEDEGDGEHGGDDSGDGRALGEATVLGAAPLLFGVLKFRAPAVVVGHG